MMMEILCTIVVVVHLLIIFLSRPRPKYSFFFFSAAPSLDDAREFATAIRAVYPDQMLSYNLSPSFNW
jgi:hypothetical protein